MSPLVSATHVQVIKKQAQKFLSEMNAQAIAETLCGLDLIPEEVQNSILRSMSAQNGNVGLLNFLKNQASEDQIEEIFKVASEQTDRGKMSKFAADILKELQQGQYRCMQDVCTYTIITPMQR